MSQWEFDCGLLKKLLSFTTFLQAHSNSKGVSNLIRVPKVPFHFHNKLKNEIQNTILIFFFNTKMEMEVQ